MEEREIRVGFTVCNSKGSQAPLLQHSLRPEFCGLVSSFPEGMFKDGTPKQMNLPGTQNLPRDQDVKSVKIFVVRLTGKNTL